MHRTYAKNVRRTISQTRGRFLAIFAIVLLGVGFLAGLLSATPDMRASFDDFFDASDMYDVEVLGTLGFTDGDAAALRKLDGVEAVQSGYIADALLQNGGREYAARMRSYSADDTINKPVLVSGRLPAAADECVVVNVFFGASASVKLGDILTLSENDKNAGDLLESREFKVVGFVNDCLNYSSETEYTNIGSGKVDLFVRVPDSAFVRDPHTELFLTVKGAKALTSLSDDYNSLVDGGAAAVKNIAGARCQIRYDEVNGSADSELAKADAKYQSAVSEANAKLAAAKKKLDDGKAKIASGAAQLADGKSQLDAKDAELADGETAYAAKKTDAEQQLAAAQEKIDAAQKTLDENRVSVQKNLTNREAELAAYGLSETQRVAFDSLRALPGQYPALVSEFEAIQTKTDRISAIDDRLAELGEFSGEALAPYADEKQALEAEKQQLQSEIAAIESGAGYTAFAAGTQALAQTGTPSYLLLANLALRLGALDAGLSQIAAAQQQLDGQRAALAQQKTAAEQQLAEARKTLDDGKAALESAKTTLAKSENQLAASKLTLARGQEDYAAAKLETENKLSDAAKKLADNRAKIEDLQMPSWTVSTRKDNSSCNSLNSNIEKVDSIAKVFPFFFFLVAALVSLTTMTRMVEEERLQIGTMKALGYSRGVIMGKYVRYALLASVLGSVVGFAIGYRLFPAIVWNCYTMMYVLPAFRYLLIWPYALGTSGAVIAFILLATVWVCNATLREKPAQLMLPKAPDPGKRVLLERVTPLWSRMKFTHKVTARNLFRYKKRLLMTVIGVAGCTALLVTGFGLRDSFDTVSARQYGAVFTYDSLVMLTGSDPLADSDLQALLADRSMVSGDAAVSYQSVTVKKGEKSLDVYSFIPENCADLDGFVDLHVRQSGAPIAFAPGSVVLTERASEMLDLKVGDSFTLSDADGNSGSFTLSGICENYVSNFVFMDTATWRAALGQTPKINALTVKLTDSGSASAARFDRAALASDAVAGLVSAADTKKAVDDELEKINTIVFVLILCAALLAFVVLYNLTNINIEERIKEIATLKVLGFTDRETRAYVSRESVVLTAIGCALGLVLGMFLHRYVMGQAEMDIIMFGRSVYPLSFVYSAALTMLFGVLVDLILGGKLKRISMVESMKAPE